MPPPNSSQRTSLPFHSSILAMTSSTLIGSAMSLPSFDSYDKKTAGIPRALGGAYARNPGRVRGSLRSGDRRLEAHAGEVAAHVVHRLLVVAVHDRLGLGVVDLLEGHALVRVLHLVAEEREDLLRDRLGLGARELGSGETDLGVEPVEIRDERVGLHGHRRVPGEHVAAGG